MNGTLHNSMNNAPSPFGPGQRVVVVGAGHSGTAACRLVHRLGAQVRLVDRHASSIEHDFAAWAAQAGVEILCGEHSAEQFAGAQAVVLSPGVPVSVVRRFVPADGPELLSETELAWRQLQGEPILGVTGTSGKTTTVSLCAAMLREQGLRVFLGGNIGTPLSQYVLDVWEGTNGWSEHNRAQVLVLELSSFQLQACTTLHPQVGVLLGISENHLDHHADMQEYTDAKMRLFRCQTPQDVAVLQPGMEGLAAAYALCARKEVMTRTDRFPSMRLFGAHNRSNAENAWLACREFGVSEAAAVRAVAAFAPIAHRLEQVAEQQGILYVNDSKCTTVAALRVALQAFDRPVLLLAGGKFKGGDLHGLRPLLAEKVRAVGLYGANRQIFEEAWQGVCPVSYDQTLEEAVHRLHGLAARGDVLLLAPATASYDQYKDYLARGDDFKRIVRELTA